VENLIVCIDGKEITCESMQVVYPPHPDDPGEHQIQAELNAKGIVVRITRTSPEDGEKQVIEVVEILRKQDLYEMTDTVSWDESEGDSLEALHQALFDCLDAEVPITKLMDYLLERTAEVALLSGVSEKDFIRSTQDGYRKALLRQAAKANAGEA